MFTQLLATAATLLLLGGHADAFYISHATLIDSYEVGVSWGTLVVTVSNGDNDEIVTGVVCDDYMTDATAEFLCRAAGFHGMVEWMNNGAAIDSSDAAMSQSS